ncbi:DUF4156 domain-containing protein [Kangiella sp. HZ709]|uniref:DUF4156 domain-containing protein n=1 Tax=Kangiella sp. HZ709 TaxID=2666328 RepID=UPI00351BAED3
MITLALSLILLSACSAIELNPDAQTVRVTKIEPGKECRYLGDVTGSQGDFFTGEFTSNEDLETGARHDLKNKAYALGGNLVYLLTDRAGQSSSFDPEYGGSSAQTNVTLSGNVYYCSELT